MKDTVESCVADCSWKLRCLLRSKKFFTNGEIVLLFKSHILSYIEYRTPGIFHATDTVLMPLDNILTKVLNDTGITSLDALRHFRLAPLCARRDIAMLGVVHRSVLGKGPVELSAFFKLSNERPARLGSRSAARRHSRTLVDCCHGLVQDYCLRSALAMPRIYNLLPEYIVSANFVSIFQSRLQQLMLSYANSGADDWSKLFSLRQCLYSHPLRKAPLTQ